MGYIFSTQFHFHENWFKLSHVLHDHNQNVDLQALSILDGCIQVAIQGPSNYNCFSSLVLVYQHNCKLLQGKGQMKTYWLNGRHRLTGDSRDDIEQPSAQSYDLKSIDGLPNSDGVNTSVETLCEEI